MKKNIQNLLYQLAHKPQKNIDGLLFLANIFLILFILVWAFDKKWQTLIQQKNDLSRTYLTLQEQAHEVAQLEHYQQQLQQMEANWHANNSQWLSVANLHTVLGSLEIMSVDAGAKLVQMLPGVIETSTWQTIYPLSLTLQGDYAQLVFFLQQLRTLPYISVHDLQIKPDEMGALHLLLNLQILLMRQDEISS